MQVKGVIKTGFISCLTLSQQILSSTADLFNDLNIKAYSSDFMRITSLLPLSAWPLASWEWFLHMQIFSVNTSYVFISLISHEHVWVLWKNSGVVCGLEFCFGCLGVRFVFPKSHEKTTIIYFNFYVFQREMLAFTLYGEGKRQNHSRNQVKLHAK